MSALNLLWFALNTVYLLAVIRVAGKRFDADFISWQEAMKRATYRSVLTKE
jgi:hypothetical protein